MADVSKNDLGRKNETEKKDNIFTKTWSGVKKHWKGIVAAAAGIVVAGAGGYLVGKNSGSGSTEEVSVPSEPVVSEPTYSDLPDA